MIAAAAAGSFTPIPNAIWRDPRLSAEAKGALGFLIAQPPHWTLNLSETCDTLGLTGRGKLRRIFRELVAAGYVIRLQQRGLDGGQFVAGYMLNREAVIAVSGHGPRETGP